MRILVGWDDTSETELIRQYLSVDQSEVVIQTGTAELLAAADSSNEWDIILLSTGTPDADSAYRRFCRIRKLQPNCPIVGACLPSEGYKTVKYMTHGMRSFLVRDSARDYMFLLHATLTGTFEAVRAERERVVADKLRLEVESIRQIQDAIIPKDYHCPDRFRVSANYETSQIQSIGGRPVNLAGGDYYNLFTLSDNHLVMLVGDASGHGLRACLSITTMHTLIRMIHSEQFRDVAEFVSLVNRRFCQHRIVEDDGGFITLLYGLLNAERNEFQWATAGHPVPLLQDLTSNSTKPLIPDGMGGLPLGVMPDARYEVFTTKLPPSSRLLLYTDGLTDAFPDGLKRESTDFGVDGLLESLSDSCQQSVEHALQALFEDSHAHTNGAGRHDDASAVLLERY